MGNTGAGVMLSGQRLVPKTLSTPSKASIKRHTHEIKTFLKKRRTAPQAAVIRGLNPIIRGWTNYHKWVICSQAFRICNRITYRQLARREQPRHYEKKSKP